MCFTKKGVVSGIIAGVLINLFALVWNLLVPGRSMWYAQAFPGMASMLGLIVTVVSFFIPGLVMGLAYDVVNKSLPWKDWKKGFAFGVGVWLLAGLMWPIMMISYAPTSIWLAEFITGFVQYAIVGLAIEAVYKKLK